MVGLVQRPVKRESNGAQELCAAGDSSPVTAGTDG